MFHDHLVYFQKSPLGGGPNTKLGDHDISNVRNRRFTLFHHTQEPA